MNVDETAYSESVQSFGKLYQVGTLQVSGCMKKISKLHGLANLLCPLGSEIIGNIYSAAHSASSHGYDRTVQHFLATVLASHMIRKEALKLYPDYRLTRMN